MGDDGPHPRRGRHQAQGTFRPCRQTQPRCVSQRLVLLLLILRGQTDHIDLSQIKPIQVQPAPWTAEASDVFFIAGDPCIRRIFSTMPRARSPELPLQNGASWADNRKPERKKDRGMCQDSPSFTTGRAATAQAERLVRTPANRQGWYGLPRREYPGSVRGIDEPQDCENPPFF